MTGGRTSSEAAFCLDELPDSFAMAADGQPTLIFADGLERLLRGELRIGRDASCDLTPAAKTVSRTHARLFEEAGVWFLEDQGSANGTRANDKPAPARMAVRLRHGD